MADYDIWVLGEANVTISGGGQLDGVSQGSGVHLAGRTITLNNRDWAPVAVTDNDTSFQDSDSSQRLNGAQTINGVLYANGTVVEAEYSFTVSDGTTSYTLIGFNVNNGSPAYGTIEGVAFVGPPGSWPPTGVPLTITATQEGPNIPAANYVTPICFAAGTLVETPHGPRRVERLCPCDMVTIHGGGAAPLRWVGRGRHRPAPGEGPVRFRAGALGNPRDLVVSPQHRIYVEDWRAELLFGTEAVLIAAKDFVNGVDVVQDEVDIVTYVHLLFDSHQIVLSEGVPTESLYPGPFAIDAMTEDARREVLEIFPGIVDHLGFGPVAAPRLKAHEARVLLAA
ncbi:Hint domain-containing protein [Anianabacter salinae]|uniref:Hint domain-containing protein n=1 Tax=Anianabacter salinae TaxID=2851023 RepID=UPI00225E2C2E|nr:Hint domain-containing protein [Anianabacter salinae]MBV0912431.1 Hint domain-containing protein [Anianabacter salinae]